ncbi:putative Seipin family protein [Helianthus annuus]|nr:putative Seipin family protein [Helianthus annuus]
METLTISHRPLLPSLRRTSVRSGVSSTPRSVTLLHLSLPHSQMLCSISNRIRKHESTIKLCVRIGWGLLWSVYCGFVLVSLLVPAFLFGGMMMRWIMEELVQVTEKLTFDYTKDTPTAFVVRVDFLSSDGNVLASTRQPCMLRFKSQPIRHVSTFLKLASVLEKRA